MSGDERSNLSLLLQYLATALSDSRHADCDTLLQKMLEVVSGGEHSNLSLLLQYLATALSDSRHADCDTLLQKMLEVVSGGDHSNLSLLLCRNIFCISVSPDFFLPFHCTK